MSHWFEYFPSNHMWSQGMMFGIEMAGWGAASISEIDQIGQKLRGHEGDNELWWAEWSDMARALAPLASRILTTRVSSARTISPDDLKAACLASGVTRPIRVTQSIAEALRGCSADPFVVVTGSLYLIGGMMNQVSTLKNFLDLSLALRTVWRH